MKTVKKILSLVIVFTMVMSFTAFAGFSDVDYDADYAGAVELLSALNIIQGDEYGNFNPDDTITRAEMAAIICRAKGLESAAKGSMGSTDYYDVPANHWASGYINMATQNGIINGHGDGRFAPEDDVTYEEAVKMIVCALGFDPMAKSKGGYPTGYLVVANTYDITDGVTATYEAPRKTVAMLLYNALSTPMMDQTTWGADAEYQVLDGRYNRDYRTLLTDMDIYIATGIVGEKTYDEVEFDVIEDSDDFEFEEGDLESFEINGSDITNYQHQNVDVYVRKVTKRSYEVVAVVAGIQGTTLTIISDDIESYSNNKVSYYIDSANSSKTKTFKLKASPSVEYNHSNYSGSLSSLLLGEEDVELKFIENTGDTTYDVIVATKYHSARVDYVDPNKDRIEIGGTTVTLEFDDEDITVILQDDRGNELDLYDFEEDDVVAVVADSTNFKNYKDYIKIIKLDNAVVRGTVEATYSSGNNDYVVIDDEEFIDGTDTNLSVGDEGLFFIGMTGKIIDFDGSSAAKDYAYILEAALSNSTFSSDKWVIKLLTMDNGIVTYNLTDDASDYFDSTYASLIGIDTSKQTKQLYQNLTAAQKADPDRLITFKTNARGYIKSIKSAQDTASRIKTLSALTDEYKESTQNMGGAYLEDNTVIFNLTGTTADKAYTIDIEYLVDDAKYSGYVYANEDYEYCVMVITDGESAFEAESGIAIATRVASIEDSEGNPVTKVTFTQNEETGNVVVFNDDSENKAGADSAYESLSVGDIFAYNASSSGYVSEYVILGKINSRGLLTANTSAYAAFNEDTEFIYGYISNTSAEKKKTSKGEVITINDGNTDEALLIANYTNKYTYNNAGRNVVIEVGDYLAEDAYFYEPEDGEVTYAFVKLVDESVVDIYTFNERVSITGSVNVETLINAIGTVEYTDACLAKIEKAENAYSKLTSTEKGRVANYDELVSARQEYNSLKDKAQAEADASAAAEVIALIEAIGTVDANSEAAIIAAEEAYSNLTSTQKTLVADLGKYEILTKAREDFDAIVSANESVDAVVDLIAAIGTVEYTPECKAKIDEAQSAYDALEDDQKAQVSNAGVLSAAAETYANLENAAKAAEVSALISLIPETVDASADCKARIDDAREAYDNLNATQRALVTNYNVLTDAEAAYSAAASLSEVDEVEALIAAIGTIDPTDESKAKIDAADKAMANLTAEQQLQVENASVLADAKAEYASVTNAIDSVITLINAIGTVEYTADSKAKIDAADKAYSNLSASQKEYVTNADKLVAAKNAYDKFDDAIAAAKVDALIDAIGTVDASATCKARIEAAEKAYENLTASQKDNVTKLATLTAAKAAHDKAVEEAKIAEDKAEAAKVDALIDAIGTVDASSASKAKIDAAEKAYADLSSAQKSYVTKLATLTAAKAAYDKAVEEAKIAEDKAEAAKVDALIDAIGTVDASSASKAKIDAAEKAYADLSSAQKNYVTKLATLTAAKAAYDKAVEEAKIAEDKAEAAKVDALIASIGTVTYTPACDANIKTAETAYGKLTSAQQKYVTKTATLTAARTTYNNLAEAAKVAADKAEAAKVDALITAITSVDGSDATKAKIEAAEKAYNDLTADQKKHVTKYTLLITARATYNVLATTK